MGDQFCQKDDGRNRNFQSSLGIKGDLEALVHNVANVLARRALYIGHGQYQTEVVDEIKKLVGKTVIMLRRNFVFTVDQLKYFGDSDWEQLTCRIDNASPGIPAAMLVALTKNVW